MVVHKELSKKEGKEPKEGKQKKKTQDFSDEYIGKDIVVKLATGEEFRGRLTDATKYWFKILIRDPNAKTEFESIEVIYVNKAYVAYVKPLS